jgi:hypothetical protein
MPFLLTGLLFTLIVALFVRTGGQPFSFVDARVYAAGIRLWLMGADPYRHGLFMNFLYPPLVLLVSGGLANIVPLFLLRSTYIALHIAAALLLPLILHRFYLQGTGCNVVAFYGLFFFAPGLLGLLALDTGNIALICYTLMLASAIPGLKRGHWLPFYLAVFCCSMIKITFLPLLVLPLFCGTGQIAAVLVCGSSAIACLEAQARLQPDLFRRFRGLLIRQSMELGDNGKGVFGILFHIAHRLHHTWLIVPMAGFGLVAACVAIGLILVKRRKLDTQLPFWPALVLVGAVFLTPRVNHYDLCVAFPLMFCIACQHMGRLKSLLIYLALLIPSLVVMNRFKDTALNGGFEALVILVTFLVLLGRLLATKHSEPVLLDPLSGRSHGNKGVTIGLADNVPDGVLKATQR